MKLICMLLFTLSTIFTGTPEEKTSINQDNQTVIASYVRTQNNNLFFTTSDAKITFHKVDKNATKTIDFTNAKLAGKLFKIEYTEEDAKTEESDNYTYRTIISIEPASSEK